MTNVFDYYDEENYLAHHGIKGQKWGIRRYQNSDGSLTPEGQKRYNAKGPKGIKGFDEDAYYEHQHREAMKKPSSISDADLDKAQRRMLSKAKSEEEKAYNSKQFETAKKSGRYELNFLEAVQNSAILRNGDERALLAEYAEYLSDPDAYWDRGRSLPID